MVNKIVNLINDNKEFRDFPVIDFIDKPDLKVCLYNYNKGVEIFHFDGCFGTSYFINNEGIFGCHGMEKWKEKEENLPVDLIYLYNLLSFYLTQYKRNVRTGYSLMDYGQFEWEESLWGINKYPVNR